MPATSDASVKKATGKAWNEWFPLLDKAGAKKLSHAEIVGVVGKEPNVGPWWQQMVTVEYERARGLRVKHQTATGFSVSASKTFAAPVRRVYSAWTTARARRRWLADSDVVIRVPRPNKSLRITWKDGSAVDVGFVDKGENKCQVAVGHGRLKSAASAARMKRYWQQQLASLQDAVER
ncbi:MAG: uncharacterized protein JWM41_4972 [Gemmatimonadetes bacterium]|nr:uncharacterized protein [Gemmatimonadota bacterium]